MRPNFVRVIPGRGCVCGVVGFVFSDLPVWATVIKVRVSRSGLERPVVEGESPVDENDRTSRVVSQVARSP